MHTHQVMAASFGLALCILAGCTSAVVLQHRTTGQTAQCGPYNAFGMADTFAAVERERGCIADYQRQGYERIR